MIQERLGGEVLLRPCRRAEEACRQAAEGHFRERYTPGTYTDAAVINAALRHQCAFFSGRIDGPLARLASLDVLELLLFEYEKASRIEKRFKSGELLHREAMRWSEFGRGLRRTLKYLAERMLVVSPDPLPRRSAPADVGLLDDVWICAEELVRLCVASDQTFFICPDDTTLEVREPGTPEYFRLSSSNPRLLAFPERILLDTTNRARFAGDLTYDQDPQAHEAFLGAPFREVHGLRYQQAIDVILRLGQWATPEGELPIPLVSQRTCVETLSTLLGTERGSTERALAGFSMPLARLCLRTRISGNAGS